MKRLIAALLALCLLFALVACSEKEEPASTETTSVQTEPTETENTSEIPAETIPHEDIVNLELPEPTFPCLDAGVAPEVIYLSNFDCGYQYIFVVGEYENADAPRIVNDTQYNILDMSVVFDNSPAERIFCFNNTICSYSPLTQLAKEDQTVITMTLLFTPGTVDMALAEYASVRISGYELGSEINMNGCNYVFNDTDYDVIIEVNGRIYSIAPHEMFESNNQFVHKLIQINKP